MNEFNPIEKRADSFRNEILDAKPDDARDIATIRQKGWEIAYINESQGITQEDIDSKDFMSEAKIKKIEDKIAAGSESSHVWIVKVDDKIVGFCNATKGDKHEVDALYILPEFQGRGLGTKLIEKATNWIGNDNDIYIDVVDYNSKALNLYTKLGFEPTGEEKEAKFPTGKTMRILILKKPANERV